MSINYPMTQWIICVRSTSTAPLLLCTWTFPIFISYTLGSETFHLQVKKKKKKKKNLSGQDFIFFLLNFRCCSSRKWIKQINDIDPNHSLETRDTVELMCGSLVAFFFSCCFTSAADGRCSSEWVRLPNANSRNWNKNKTKTKAKTQARVPKRGGGSCCAAAAVTAACCIRVMWEFWPSLKPPGNTCEGSWFLDAAPGAVLLQPHSSVQLFIPPKNSLDI